MLLIGLTGSIATGKSTVASLLTSPPYSLPHIDADVLARDAVAPGTRAYRRIVAHFLPTTPDLLLPPPSPSSSSSPSQTTPEPPTSTPRPLNRAVLGRRVFGADATRTHDRAVLNGIVHPAVRRAMAWSVAGAYARGHWAVVLDVPLLYEAGLDVWCGAVVMVGVRDEAVQVARMVERDGEGKGVSVEEARERVRSQGGVEGKVERCRFGEGWVVWNDAGREELRGEVERVVSGLREGRPWWWGGALWVCPVLAGLVGVWVVARNWWARRRWEKMVSEREREKGE
ncbi:MAG: hypothetical protein M1833_001120 [Piccolia ochrophora]|nr:MAG: hypothetical protein M1833_001120 [Piccolia ochrophora]